MRPNTPALGYLLTSHVAILRVNLYHQRADVTLLIQYTFYCIHKHISHCIAASTSAFTVVVRMVDQVLRALVFLTFFSSEAILSDPLLANRNGWLNRRAVRDGWILPIKLGLNTWYSNRTNKCFWSPKWPLLSPKVRTPHVPFRTPKNHIRT